LHQLAGATEQTFVVTSLPDEKKGERLIVLHKLAEGPLQACLEKFAASDLPNLWKPRPDQFFHVSAFHIWAPANWTCGSARNRGRAKVPLQRQILRPDPLLITAQNGDAAGQAEARLPA